MTAPLDTVSAGLPGNNGLICWHDRPRWGCGHFSGGRDDAFIRWGRCRTGRRWFWTAAEILQAPTEQDIDDTVLHGSADTEGEALSAACEAVAQIAAGRPAVAELRHGDASRLLQTLNARRRAARPDSGETSAAAVEYVYGTRYYVPDDALLPEVREVVRYRVTRKTPRRVYYARSQSGRETGGTGYVSRKLLNSAMSVRISSTSSYQPIGFLPVVALAGTAANLCPAVPALPSKGHHDHPPGTSHERTPPQVPRPFPRRRDPRRRPPDQR